MSLLSAEVAKTDMPNSTSYLVTGTTRGDDLVPSKEVVLAACDTHWDAQAELNRIRDERDDFMQEHGDSIPWWALCTLYNDFQIRQVPHVGPVPDAYTTEADQESRPTTISGQNPPAGGCAANV
jgi:hypothetical protein